MIKKLVMIAALAMLLGSPTSYAAIVSGNSLVQYCEKGDAGFEDGFCYGYMVGVYEKMVDVIICPPNGVTVNQIASIVMKYLKENPEDLHLSAISLVSLALAEAFEGSC